ncbi:hypothetical protein DRJ25_06265, partial [Candidatus Woesearchaeota archaeon]
MVTFDRVKVEEVSPIDELSGRLKPSSDEKLMHSVLQNDKEVIQQGELIVDAINRGIGAFSPELVLEQLVKNFALAKSIFGDRFLRLLTGYDPDYLKKNIKIPEFQRELKKIIEERIKKLKHERFLKNDSSISDRGINLASLILYMQEIDALMPRGFFGEKLKKKSAVYGERSEHRKYRKGDRYKDLALRYSVKLAVRRSHRELLESDLMTFERKQKGQIYVIYGLDASGSMKGKKIEMCKKAGVALAFKAIQEKDKVGLIVFGTDIKNAVPPTGDFGFLLHEITKIKPSMQTNLVETIRKGVELFPKRNVTKHLVLISDALPTVGKEPEQETLEAVSAARDNDITISVVGIKLDEKGKRLARKIVELGRGRLYTVR